MIFTSPAPALRRGRAEARRRITVGLSLLATTVTGALIAPGAHASSAATTIEQHVSYRDLDLTRRADVALLKRRVTVAVHNVCRWTPERQASGEFYPYECTTAALREGQRQISRAVARAHARSKAGLAGDAGHANEAG